MGYIPRGRKESDTTEQLHFHFPSGSEVKNSPVNAGDTRETGTTPGQEDSLEEGIPTYSSILAWRIP